MPSCPAGVLVCLVADFADLTPVITLGMVPNITHSSSDVEINPGAGYLCTESQPEQFPSTDKNVSKINSENLKVLLNKIRNFYRYIIFCRIGKPTVQGFHAYYTLL